MTRQQNPTSLAHLWQKQAEIDIESGRRPLVGVGLGNVDAESVTALLAVQRFARRAGGLGQPQVLAGGDGDVWLSALLLRPLAEDDTPSSFDVIYAGGDAATHAASLTIATSSATMLGPKPLPPGMAWMLTPTALPGSERGDLEYLPFVEEGAPFAPVSACRRRRRPGSIRWKPGLSSCWRWRCCWRR
ncbi:MAG: hypothetical protein R2873_31020 [Caldilineaceae bacterium]